MLSGKCVKQNYFTIRRSLYEDGRIVYVLWGYILTGVDTVQL